MTDAKRAEVARENILKLLSDEEVAKVSTAEAASGLTEGTEYLDLEHLEQGVQRAKPRLRSRWGMSFPVARSATEPGARSLRNWEPRDLIRGQMLAGPKISAFLGLRDAIVRKPVVGLISHNFDFAMIQAPLIVTVRRRML